MADRRAAVAAPPVLVEVTRGDLIESRHRGSIAVVSADGSLVASLGDINSPVFVRSAAKPFQLAPFVSSGHFDAYGFGTDAMAVMASSHSGEDRHVRTVMAALRAGGLTQSVLQCGPATPADRETAARLARDGEPPTEIRNYCSGKHAGFALFAKASGWEVEEYWRAGHEVQLAARAAVVAATDAAPERLPTATDGCGVPTFAVSLKAMALAFARLAAPDRLPVAELRSALARIRDAMMAEPVLVGGSHGRLDTDLMAIAPGRLAVKFGAEGIQGVAVLATPGHEALGLAMKIEDGDGARRARTVAACAALSQLGVLSEANLRDLRSYAAPLIRDPRGGVSGEVRPAFSLV